MATRKGAKHATNIMEELAASRRPLSAYDLLDRLRPSGVGAPLTVYRALDKLIKAGQVHRIESLNAFVACRSGDHAGHDHAEAVPNRQTVAFAICDRCGAVEEFVDPALCDRIGGLLSARSFVPRTSALEVHGVCAACHAAA